MSVLNRIFEAGACAAALPLPALCAGTSVTRGRPGAHEMSLCSSRWYSSFESTLKPACSQHFWRCHLVDTELTSWPPPILKGFRWGAFLLFSSNIQLLHTRVSAKLWSGGQHFLHDPSCHNVACTRCSWCLSSGVLILCPATLFYPGQVCTQVWRTMTPDPLSAAQMFITVIFIAVGVDAVP